MGFFGRMFDNMGNFFGNFLDFTWLRNLSNKYTGSGLTDADREANAFTERMQEDAQTHDREMADYNDRLARQYYQDIQSPQAQVAQFQAAGINPAMMYGRGVGSVPSPAQFGSSGGSGASSVKPDSGDIGQLISLLGGLAIKSQEAKADIDLKGAQQFLFEQEADLKQKENQIFMDRWTLQRETMSKSIENIGADVKLKEAQRLGYLADVDLKHSQRVINEWDAKLKEVDFQTRADYNQACLDEVNARRSLEIAQTELEYALKGKTKVETDYMQKKVNNLQRELDDAHNKVVAEVDKIAKEAGLTKKEIDYYENKFNLEVISTTTGVMQAAKITAGDHFYGMGTSANRFFDKVGHSVDKSFKNFGSKSLFPTTSK